MVTAQKMNNKAANVSV